MSKEETKEETKKEAKPAAKKPAAKPKKKAAGAKGALEKAGYVDIYDYITLAVGIWGFIWALVGFLVTAPTIALLIPQITGIIDPNFYAFMTWLGLYIIELWIYITLALFPFVIKGLGIKVLGKWPDTFPLHFIKTAEDLRAFMVFAAWWSGLFFWIADPWMRWPHFISVVLLTIVLLADALHKKISKMPRKKIIE
jgi:hypothetical protein